MWWALEDLWLRLAALGLLSVEQGRAGVFVVVRNLRDTSSAGELRSFAMDAETYQSRAGGRIRSFVRTMAFRGDDLVCELTPAPVIARWPDGEGLALQVRALVARLAAISRWGDGEGGHHVSGGAGNRSPPRSAPPAAVHQITSNQESP